MARFRNLDMFGAFAQRIVASGDVSGLSAIKASPETDHDPCPS